MLVRDLRQADLPAVLELNRIHEAVLSVLDADGLARLVSLAEASWVAEIDGAVAGFAVAFAPGSEYDSANYRWFSERYEDFVYLDRIAVSGDHRRKGVGDRLYDELDALAAQRGAPVVCEVDLVPRNDTSLAFHRHRGFEPVGELEHPGGKIVQLMVRRTSS